MVLLPRRLMICKLRALFHSTRVGIIYVRATSFTESFTLYKNIMKIQLKFDIYGTKNINSGRFIEHK